MIDPVTAWRITKILFHLLFLLLKSAALIGVVYFAIFTNSFIQPFFATTHNNTCEREARIVNYCCFVVLAFLLLLLAEHLVRLLLSVFPSGERPECLKKCRKHGEALWLRVAYVVVMGVLLGVILFGTLYPLLKGLEWRGVFAAAGRPDLQKSAMAMVVFMGITLGVGTVSLLSVSWALIVRCFGLAKQGLGGRKNKKKNGDGEGEQRIPLETLPSFRVRRQDYLA